ncbi:MAG: glycogen/starch synthase, partial [Erysipelotrichaceae bacterium]|nr:glycogen/starch synthase [Erysipelotrichaceae bacterium]
MPAKKASDKTVEKETEKKTAVKKASAKTTTARKVVKKETVEAKADEIMAAASQQAPDSPRRSIAFIGSECYPFVKTGGLGDVMYALPKAL